MVRGRHDNDQYDWANSPFLNYRYEMRKEEIVNLDLTPIKQESLQALSVQSNSGKTYKYTTGKNEFTGEVGWRPIDLSGFDPVSSAMAVHDIMEHFPGDEYGPHNEYQAQGAMFWLRHESGYFNAVTGGTSTAVIKPAFGMLFHHIHNKQLTTEPCPFVHEAHTSIPTGRTEIEMALTVANAIRYIYSEFKLPVVKADAITAAEAESLNQARDFISKSVTHALGWMRVGYRRAEIRYKGMDKSRLYALYVSLQKTLERLLPLAKDSPKSTLEVTISFEKYEATTNLREVASA